MIKMYFGGKMAKSDMGITVFTDVSRSQRLKVPQRLVAVALCRGTCNYCNWWTLCRYL